MSNCIIKSRIKGSEGEPSTLLKRINNFYSGLKRPDGSNPVYDKLQDKSFLSKWGGDYSYKEPGDKGYEEFQRVEELYENKQYLHYEDGEPKFYEGDGVNPYLINYKGEKIYLNDVIIKEQDRLDIANAIFMSIYSDDLKFIYKDMDTKSNSYVEYSKRFFQDRMDDLKSDIKDIEEALEQVDDEWSEQDIEDLLEQQVLLGNRLKTLETILNSKSLIASINASLKQSLQAVGFKHSVDDVIENQDEDTDAVSGMDDFKNHTKDSTEIRDTENIDSEILVLFSSIIDFTIGKNGAIYNKNNTLMGDKFVLGMSPNKVKNRVFETVANIIEIEANTRQDRKFVSSYDAMIQKLEQRALENNDELLKRFNAKLKAYTANLSKQDLFSFQVKFFKAASKAMQNFILTEMVGDSNNLKLTYIDPANIQNKESVIGKDIFLSAVERFNVKKQHDSKYLTSEDTKTIDKQIELLDKAKVDSTSLQEFFDLVGINLSKPAADFLVNNANNLTNILKLTRDNYTLENLLDDFMSESKNIRYNYKNDKGEEASTYTDYYSAIIDYSDLTKSQQEGLLKGLVNKRLSSIYHVLGTVESIFKPDVTDSSFNIVGKSRWKYSLMGGINKEILRWKSGNKYRLENLRHRNIPYVNYLLATRPQDNQKVIDYAKLYNLTDLDEAREMLSNERIQNVDMVVFSQMRKDDDVVEFKSIGEGDLILDQMFKIMNFNDEIYEFYRSNYQGANKDMIDNFIKQSGKALMPSTNNADKSSSLGLKGLVDPSDEYLSEVAGLDNNMNLDENAKAVFRDLFFGEIESALRHQELIRGYYNISAENTQERNNYLMNKLIPEVHYMSNYSIEMLNEDGDNIKNKEGENKTKSYKFKPELGNRTIYKKDSEGNIIIETGILHAGFVNRGSWNKLGVFNSILNDNYNLFQNTLFKTTEVTLPEVQPEETQSFKPNVDNATENTETRVDEMLSDKAVYNVNNTNQSNAVMYFNNTYKGLFVDNLETGNVDTPKISLNDILYKAIESKLEYNFQYFTRLPGENLTTIPTNITDSTTERSLKQFAMLSLINEISLMNMFNGELMFFKQGKNSTTLSLEDFLKRGPAPSTDGLQYNIVDTGTELIVNGEVFNSAKEGRKDNFINYAGEKVSVDRNREMVFAVVNNLDIGKSSYSKEISDGLGYEIEYGHEIADAGAYMTLGFYKRTMLQVQGWSEHDEKMFNELNDPNTIMTEDHYKWLKVSGHTLDPKKLVGYDFMQIYQDDGITAGAIDVPVFLKFGPAIIAPAMVNNSDVANLLEKMDNDGIDLVVSKSGSKVSNKALTTIHKLNEEGNFDGLLEANEMKLNPAKFNLSNLKWQVELPAHYFNENNIGTQHLKNIIANLDLESQDRAYFYKDKMLTAEEILGVYENAVVNILKYQFNRFKKELGIDILDGNGINYKSDKLREFLIRELDPAEDFHIINLLRNTNNPIETVPGIAQRMFPVLAGYIKKNVGKVNTNTGSVIQVANIGFDRLKGDLDSSDILFFNNDTTLTPPKPVTVLDLKRFELDKIADIVNDKTLKKELEIYQSYNAKRKLNKEEKAIFNSLKEKYKDKYVYYESDGKNINISLTKTPTNKMRINNSKVLIPFADIQKELGMSWSEFKEAMIKDRQNNWEKGVKGKFFDQRILENIISYRIPNQSMSSNDKMEIVGILPPQFGDKAVVYHEITAKAGSDYDIDKLYLMIPSYNIDKKVNRVHYVENDEENVSEKGYHNQLIEAMGSILSSEKTYDDLMSPLDSPIIKDSMYEVKYDYFKKANPDSEIESLSDYKESMIVDPLTMLTPAYKLKNRVDMTSAKQLVAIMANHMTHVPFSQIQKIVLESSLGFGNTNLHGIYVKGYEGNNEMKITKMVSYFMNAAVDAAKDNYIIEGNFNSYTANAAMVLVRSGVHPKEVFKLLLHPEILEISKIKQAETELTTDIKLKSYRLDKDSEDKYIKKYLNFIKINPIETSNFEEFLNHIAHGDQIDLLKGYWLTLVETGKQLADDISVSKPEAKGAGKNIYEHLGIYNKIGKVAKSNIGRYINGEFRTLNHLYTTGIPKDDLGNFKPEFIDPSNPDNDIALSRYTMFGMMMNNSLLLTNLIAKNMFIEASDNYVNMVNNISAMSGNVLDSTESNIKEVSKYLYPTVIATANHELYNMSWNEQQNTVNYINENLIKFKNHPALKNNMIIDLLNYNEKTGLVEFPGYKTLDARDKNQLRHDFNRLYNAPYLIGYKNIITGDDADVVLKEIERFAKLLITYSYIANGFKKTRNSFEEYLPYTYFGETNHGLAIENLLNVLNNNSQYSEEFTQMIDSSLSMLVYTNPTNYRFVKDFKRNNPNVTFGKVVEDYTKLINKRTGNYYPFFTFINQYNTRTLVKLVSTERKRVHNSKTGQIELVDLPIYEQMLVGKTDMDSTKHVFLYTSLFKTKGLDQKYPLYLKSDNINMYNGLPNLLLNNNNTIYESRLDQITNSIESLNDIPDVNNLDTKNTEVGNNINNNPGNLTFEEEQSTGYRERTVKNASADITLAFASDFNSAGEKLTKSSVLNQNKIYHSIDMSKGFNYDMSEINEIVDKLKSLNKRNIVINIAGNGIYTFKGQYTQQEIDNNIEDYLNDLTSSLQDANINVSIRTGGQTGADEAGVKAGLALGLPTYILAPKGWKFRDITGKDISNEKLFKERFNLNTLSNNNDSDNLDMNFTKEDLQC